MKLVVKILFVVAMLALFVFGYSSLALPDASAETVPQMRLRLFAEAQQKHPDVWNGCNPTCVTARLQAAPYLTGLAKQANVDVNDLARYSIVRAYDWGLDFEKLYGRPPTDYDWSYAYADNAEQLRYELAASPVIFIENSWAMKQRFVFKYEYNGPY